MSRFPISRFGRRYFDFDNFFGNTLDFFDPFDTWDLSLRPSHLPALNWITEPPRLFDRPAEKYRITLPVTGYSKNDISTSIVDSKLKVIGKHVNQEGTTDNYNCKEFSKTFELPKDIDGSKLTSFITTGGMLVIEIPFISQQQQQLTQTSTGDSAHQIQISRNNPVSCIGSSFMPVITDDTHVVGSKKIEMNVQLQQYRPDQIQLTLKDRDLILKAESSEADSHHSAKQFLCRQVTLPAGTNTDKLFSTFENGILHIEAPFSSRSQQQTEQSAIQ